MAEDQYYYLTYDKHPHEDGKLLAVITLVQKGDKKVTVCSIETVSTPDEARRWMAEEMKTKPWLRG